MHGQLLFELFDQIKNLIGVFGKFHMKQKQCYEFSYKQIFTKMIGLTTLIKRYR